MEEVEGGPDFLQREQQACSICQHPTQLLHRPRRQTLGARKPALLQGTPQASCTLADQTGQPGRNRIKLA
jgi:hypothetical protein